jgi:hypothetical protein
MRRDLILALSLANLCYMPAWSKLIAHDPLGEILRYDLSQYQGLLISVLLLGAALWSAMTLVRWSQKAGVMRLAEWAFLLILIVPISGFLHTQVPAYSPHRAPNPLQSTHGVVWLAAIPIGASLLVRFRKSMIRLFVVILLVMSPFVVITFTQAALLMTEFRDKRLAHPVPTRQSRPRILWLVFDEMDERLAFARRPPTVRLPELDRLRAESLSAEDAHPPSWWTIASMPALITGKLVSAAKATSPSELALTYAGTEESVPWSAEPNVFSRAREAGSNTALSGWLPPYCRIIGHTLTKCTNWAPRTPLWKGMQEQMRRVIDSLPLASSLMDREPWWQRWLVSNAQSTAQWTYTAMLKEARQWATDPDLGLIFVHWAFPHFPVIYDRHRDILQLNSQGNYFDNLVLVDRTLGELRRAMEQAGLWDSTIVLVTSDHSFRRAFYVTNMPEWPTEENEALSTMSGLQVPFILKLSGRNNAVRYEPSFNTVLTHDLVLALLRGEVTSPASVVAWLDRHRSLATGS